MADYYPLIARAIAGLDPSAPGESRRALYERARTALISQLRSVQPPLSESEITRERLSLEEAVRKVESEAAQRARDARSGGGAAASSSRGDAFRRANATSRPGEAAAAPAAGPARQRPPVPSQPPPPSRNDRPPLGQDGERPRPPRADAPPPPPRPQSPQISMQDPQLPPVRDRAGQPPPTRRGPDNGSQAPGVRGFRDITADADDLGRAAAQANRAARKTYANVPSPSPEFDRIEPDLDNRGGDYEQPYSYDNSMEEAERYSLPAPPVPRARIGGDRDTKPKRARSGTVFPFKSAIAIGIVLILVGAAILWGKSVVSTMSGLFSKSSTVVERQRTIRRRCSKPKIPDRVGQPSSTSSEHRSRRSRSASCCMTRIRPIPRASNMSARWSGAPNRSRRPATRRPDIAVRADIEIPDRKFKMTMSFRRNTDSSLPASHTAELTFILPPDFAGGGVGNVPGILMKSNEQARGTPLAGLAVKVTDGFFLVGLSNVDADRSRNVQLLKERSWFDVPLVYTNQRRAIIAIEKGAPGERAFNDAFAPVGRVVRPVVPALLLSGFTRRCYKRRRGKRDGGMKRYLIFAAVGPLLGGFWLFLTTYLSGYWSHADRGRSRQAVRGFLHHAAIQLSVRPLAGADDRRDRRHPVPRQAHRPDVAHADRRRASRSCAPSCYYGSRGPDTGTVQFILYGLVGFIPATINSWLVYRFVEEPRRPRPRAENGRAKRLAACAIVKSIEAGQRPLPRQPPLGPM